MTFVSVVIIMDTFRENLTLCLTVNKNGTAGVLETKIEVMYSRTKAAFIVFVFFFI